MKDSSNLYMINSIPNKSNWWQARVTGIRFSDGEAYRLNGAMGILDSGNSCLTVPGRYYYWLIFRLEKYGLLTSKWYQGPGLP